MRRIAVLGCAGSGKTTLARALGERLGLPVIHVDSVYWRGQDGRFGAEWPEIHGELISRDEWVIDAMKPGVLPQRLARADTAIFLDLPRRGCFRGLLERRLASRGVPTGGDAANPIDWSLLVWMWRFPRVVRPRVLESLRAGSCDVIVLRSRADIKRFVEVLPTQQPRLGNRHGILTEA